jgi:hypothetical protein
MLMPDGLLRPKREIPWFTIGLVGLLVIVLNFAIRSGLGSSTTTTERLVGPEGYLAAYGGDEAVYRESSRSHDVCRS